jgi:exodeoxyribonuclease-1
MAAPTFFWHDYETSGADPRRDRPLQFAGIRTTLDLEPVGEPLMLYCKPASDSLPHPQAAMITGITPQQAEREGAIEAEFAAVVHEQLAAPGTCGVGYNSLRFDDEFTRHLLYRNFYDPYEREWRNDNSRWDLIDLARLCYALRPDGIEWPLREDGTPSFRLEHLAAANRLDQQRAHDALSDVHATIGLARLIRARQPRLWDWYFALRRKQQAFAQLDIAHMTPVLHVSSRYPASRGCLAMVVPLAVHPTRSNEVIVYDLACDPRELLALDAGDLADRMFTPRADLPEGVERIALRTVRTNRAPALAPLSVLNGVDTARIGLDVDAGMAHLQQLRGVEGLAEKLRQVFAARADLPPADDPELNLYGCFLPDADKPLLARVRTTPPALLGTQPFAFRDPRCSELLFRYRARNWPETLDLAERARWDVFRRARLTHDTPLSTLTLPAYFVEIATRRADPTTTSDQRGVLDQLELWGRDLMLELGIDLTASV